MGGRRRRERKHTRAEREHAEATERCLPCGGRKADDDDDHHRARRAAPVAVLRVGSAVGFRFAESVAANVNAMLHATANTSATAVKAGGDSEGGRNQEGRNQCNHSGAERTRCAGDRCRATCASPVECSERWKPDSRQRAERQREGDGRERTCEISDDRRGDRRDQKVCRVWGDPFGQARREPRQDREDGE